MEDMLKAVERGQTELSPRTKAKYLQGDQKKPNKFQESRALKQKQILENKKNKDIQLKQRNLKIKKEIELYSAEKANKKREIENK